MTPGPSPARDPLITDAEFKTELDIVANEVYEATYIHHTMEEINDLARTDHGILVAIERTTVVLAGAPRREQAALFMCLGRIFDTDDATSSIHRLIRITRVNLHVFSSPALGARKMGSGPKPFWFDNFMAAAWEPQTAADFGSQGRA